MKKGIIKKILIFLSFAIIIIGGTYYGINKLEEKDLIDVGGGFYVKKLDTPKNVKIEDNVLSWDYSYQDIIYVIKIDKKSYKTSETSFDLSFLATEQRYEVKIKATSDKVRDSNWSASMIHIAYSEEDQKKLMLK